MAKTDKPKYVIHGYCKGSTEGYDDESTADTLKEAKERAKYMMTEEHTRIVESTVPIVYVAIKKHDSDDIILDFGKDPSDSLCTDVRCELPADHEGQCEPEEHTESADLCDTCGKSDVEIARTENGETICVECDTEEDDDELEDDDEPTEPDEDAITTSNERDFYQYGKKVLTITEDQDREHELMEYMNRTQFWPDCWVISDHGNPILIDFSHYTSVKTTTGDKSNE